jgi:ferrous iron transport protein A
LQLARQPVTAPAMTLDQLPPRSRAEIVAIDWSVLAPDEAKRLLALGVDEGAQVTVAHRGMLGARDPIALEIGRMTLAVRRSHAAAVTVKEL